MIYHFVVGDEAAKPLQEAIEAEPSMAGEVVVLRDVLSVGPLQKAEGQTFSELRSAFWQDVTGNDKVKIVVDDMERLLEISKAMYENEDVKAWFWMAPIPADVCAYHWLLHYMSKHIGRFYLINIAGLPFLDETGKVFYPKSFSYILPKEIIKARKLARPVTPSEVEVDGEEWRKLVQEDTGIRTAEGGKKLTSRSEDFYDKILTGFCTQQFQKASKVINAAIAKHGVPTGDTYLGWRLRKMAEAGQIKLQGDTSKALKDFDVKLFSAVVTENNTSS
ncbi:DUF3658 domain-containing protein [Taibaiella soli]|uniref:DUF1835 domain-containing protein n=1 Tax=Taibaiella soli TaxID=1649169 RepID=A0A2W2AFW3_9BACT|nr:DUF3658 domain-containing protein [Taibaiella soli]PZF72402.1 hypothetical protein DN068_13695 [Taibaiella soli]